MMKRENDQFEWKEAEYFFYGFIEGKISITSENPMPCLIGLEHPATIGSTM